MFFLFSLSAVAIAAFGSVLYYHHQTTQFLLEERKRAAHLELKNTRRLLGTSSVNVSTSERLISEIQVGDVLAAETADWVVSSTIEFQDEDESLFLHILDDRKGPFLFVLKEKNEWRCFFIKKEKTPFGINIDSNTIHFSENIFRLKRRTRAKINIFGPMTINLNDVTTIAVFQSNLKNYLIGIERPDGILLLSDIDITQEEVLFLPT